MRGRLSFQSVPADHPSVVALTAMNPVIDPATLQAIVNWGSRPDLGRTFDPMVGEQLLYVHVNGEITDFYTRNVGTGQIRVFGFENDGDPDERRGGGYAFGGIANSIKQYERLPTPILKLFADMADAPWVD